MRLIIPLNANIPKYATNPIGESVINSPNVTPMNPNGIVNTVNSNCFALLNWSINSVIIENNISGKGSIKLSSDESLSSRSPAGSIEYP